MEEDKGLTKDRKQKGGAEGNTMVELMEGGAKAVV